MNFEINAAFKTSEDQIRSALDDFDSLGSDFLIGKRNRIKVFEMEGYQMNVKSFKIPNIINRIVYRHFRKSKARRSFEFAHRLLSARINTPIPIAYMERRNLIGLKESYYASIHQEYDFTCRKLTDGSNHADTDNILRQFSRFCYKMHEIGIEFKDHSPGNTLIKKVGEGAYKFFLVDLNRMQFHNTMDIRLRMKTLSRLTRNIEVLRIITEEYASLTGHDPVQLFDILWKYTGRFQKRFHRKQKIKRGFEMYIGSGLFSDSQSK